MQADADLRGIYLEDLCFDAQQAAEKAIKAVLMHFGIDFPYIHDLARLITLAVDAGHVVPEDVRAATALSPYAFVTRYPAAVPAVSREEYLQAVDLATTVVRWAEGIIGYPPPSAS